MLQSLFWENLAPTSAGGGAFPTAGPLFEAVKADFGSVDALKAALIANGMGIQGSGWTWLVRYPLPLKICRELLFYDQFPHKRYDRLLMEFDL
jgi:superoxide dismutase